MFSGEDLVKSHKSRADAITNIVLICFAIILARLWYLQVYKGKVLLEYSIKNRLRKEVVRAPRGMMFSRNNRLIVNNVPRFDATITPQYLKNKKKTINKISNILSMSPKSVYGILKKHLGKPKYQPIVIKKNISRKEVAFIETEGADLPGVSVDTFISREYRDGEIGAHLFGYISEISKNQLPKYRKRDKLPYKLGDFIGQSGLEEKFDLTLRGKDGHEFVEVDALGRRKTHILADNLFTGIDNEPSVPGNNLKLTIDSDLQKSAYEALQGKVGGAVAVDIHTGEILAIVSQPSFNPAVFSRGLSSKYWQSLVNDSNNPLWDRTIQEHYAPGSTFKVITAIAGLETGIIDEKTTVNCKGHFKLGRRRFHCWKKYGHGNVKIIKAIRESCDVFFYKLASKMDIDVLAKYARFFGFGKKTMISLPREASGLIPTREWKKKKNGEEWQLGETLSCAIGQSYVLATPIQMAMFISTIANGGTLYRPYLVKEIFTNSGVILKRNLPEKVLENKISQKTLSLIQQGLFQVVNNPKGTAWWQRGRGIHMAGKTGTSQVIRFAASKIFNKCEDNEYEFRHHGLFVSYAPFENPQIAVAVIVEHGCHGSSAAAPVARQITQTYMKKYWPNSRSGLTFVNQRPNARTIEIFINSEG